MSSLVIEKKITVAEFLKMDFEEGFLYELINGIIVKRASPSAEHQNIVSNLNTEFNNFIKPLKIGKCYPAPLDVYLTNTDLTQPDLIYVSKDRAHIVKGFIEGVPDLLVEILSPGTAKTDRGTKRSLYERCGVAEYWIIDPKSQSIEIYILENGHYELYSFAQESGEVESKVLVGFKLSIEELFH